MHTPTPEQQAIIDATTQSEDNLLISALAGAAKTSTLVMLSEANPVKTLCLAFNKKIADEMAQRLPAHCDSMTLNSLGHRTWGSVLGRRLIIDSSKVGNILKVLFDKLDPELRKQAWEGFTDLIKAIGFGKQCGYIPDNYERMARPLMSSDEFEAHYETKFEDWEWALIHEASKISLDQAWNGLLDYDDQILMPTIFPAPFPRYPLVLVDEAQDLSALNHATLKKLVVKRLIAVGDPCQAIYGFRGAHEESMELLRQTFSMKEMTLSISFRCPIKVVEHARWRAPSMQYPEWAKPGSVSALGLWSVDDIPRDAAIICRNNAPLFSLAIKLLQKGRYAQLLGNDIGRSLLKVMSKFGDPSLKQKDVLSKITDWCEEKKAKTKNPSGVEDRAECMRIFARAGKNLSEAIAFAEHIFNSDGPIKLMTGHKSKGLEFDNVFILDRDLLRDEGQDRNLRYVMITRAKETLTYLKSADFEGEQDMA